MSIQTNVDLGFPLRLFSVGCEPKPKKSINHHSKTEFLEDVENDVGEEVWDIVRASPLGVIIRFVENKFTWSSKIVEHLLVNQLACKKKQEMWCLFGNTPARFSLSEFENITALNCAPFVEDDDVTETKVHKGLWKKLKVQRKSPCKRELKGALEDVYLWSTEDKIPLQENTDFATDFPRLMV